MGIIEKKKFELLTMEKVARFFERKADDVIKVIDNIVKVEELQLTEQEKTKAVNALINEKSKKLKRIKIYVEKLLKDEEDNLTEE
jgi:mevalonate kinase